MTEYIRPRHITNALANLPQLVFEVTDACNLNCKYCAYGDLYEDYDKRQNKKMSFDTARRLIDYLFPFWVSQQNTSSKSILYISFYGGEPLMNMGLIKKIVEYTNSLHIPHRHLKFSMTTNAILLEHHMEYLVEKDFSLLISLDGNKKNNSYRVDHRGESSFEKVIRNIDLLAKKHPNYFQKNVNFNSVLHNRSSVEEIYTFIKKRYNKIPNISDLNNIGIKKEKQEEFNSMFLSYKESLDSSKEKEEIKNGQFLKSPDYRNLTIFLRQYSGFAYKDYTDLLFDKSEAAFIPTGTCIPFTKKLYLSVNGKILPCERIGQQFYLGEVTDKEVNIDPNAIAKLCNERLSKIESTCKSCYNKKNCSQCIYNLEGIDKKAYCNGFMDKKSFQLYWEKNIYLIRQNPYIYKTIMTKVISK